MLTSLQGQVELGDCAEGVYDYRAIAGHCLPPRFVPNIPNEGVAMHHQSLRGMTQPEAKYFPLLFTQVLFLINNLSFQEIVFESDSKLANAQSDHF